MLVQPTDFVNSLGYLGIFLLIFVFPVPQELVLPLAGFIAAQGKLSLVGVVASGVIGSALGSLPWYWAGRHLSEEHLTAMTKQHRWIKLSKTDLRRTTQWFDRAGSRAVLLSQFIPIVRTLISLPAGMSQMNFGLFWLCLLSSATVWQGSLAYAGYVLGGQYHLVNQYGNWVRTGVGVLIAIAFIGIIRRKKMK